MRAARATALLLAATLLAGATPARSTTVDPNETSPHGWTFAFTPYVWLPAQTGRIGLNGKTARVDVSIEDSLDLMGDHLSLIAGFFHLEARHGRFFMLLDTTLSALDTGGGTTLTTVNDPRIGAVDLDATLEQNVAIVEGAVGYRLLEMTMPERRRPVAIEAFTGFRYYYFWTKIRVDASNAQLGAASRTATGDVDWVDPMIGGRFTVPVLDQVDLQAFGDIGGFGAGSELSWSMAGFLRYSFDSRPLGIAPWLALGYKVLDFDWEDGRREMDLNMAGPALALGATF